MPAPPRPKRKSSPDEHRPDAERADQHVLHELPRGQARELLVEAQHERRVDARLGEQLQLLVHADEVLGADLGAQQRERIAVEGHRHDAGAAGGGIHAGPVDDGAVTGVHAVELADRDDRRTEAGGHLRRGAEDDHGATAALGIRRRRARGDAWRATRGRRTAARAARRGSRRRTTTTRSGARTGRASARLRVPITSTPTSSKKIATHATRYHPREPAKMSASVARMYTIADARRQRVRERRLVESLDDLDERATGRGRAP